jgi:Flp pilus assembly protein TadG
MRSTGRNKARRLHGDDGVVAVEFALLAPLLFLLLFGIIQFGRAYNAKVELTSAVREGVRAFSLKTGDPVAVTRAAAPGLNAGTITVTTSASPCTAGSSAWVRASYPFALDIPFWGNQAVTIAAKGVMRCGG